MNPTAAVLVVIVLFEIVLTTYQALLFWRTRKSIYAEVGNLENKAEKEISIVGFTETLLSAAAERQQLSVITAERRAGNLFRVGTLLMIVSVVVPFILVAMYLQTDPATIVTSLKSLGVSPADAAKAAQRDWHLLVAGVSFGLLFLAAAKGILAAESKQLEIYSNEVRGSTYYGDLSRALKIAERLDAERKNSKHSITEEVVRKIIVNLLDRGHLKHNASQPWEIPTGLPQDHELLKIVTDLLKK
jgi:hypothetical protein